jgi:hypothetical protein
MSDERDEPDGGWVLILVLIGLLALLGLGGGFYVMRWRAVEAERQAVAAEQAAADARRQADKAAEEAAQQKEP